jgi:hypothetical protein
MLSTVNTDELIAAACPEIGDLGWAFYFTPETLARGRELGLDGFRFYFAGRGGVLGDVDAQVVQSAFGYFEPSLLARMWNESRAVLAPRTAGREFMACAADHGRRTLTDLEGLSEFCAAADAVNAAADPTSLALYAAVSAEPLVEDLPGRAMQLVAVLRELRGSAHLVALRSVGLDTLVAHVIARPGDLGLFGWTEGDAPTPTDEDRAALAEAERVTDRIVAPAFAVLDDDGAAALLGGIERIGAALRA